MLSSAQRPTDRSPKLPVRVPTICVVDPQAEDYRNWESLAQDNGTKLQIVASAEAALRLAATTTVDLWVINTTLPGLSGCELCRMLKARTSTIPVYLVADEYSPAAELAALQSQATLFGCKPGHESWFGEWFEQSRRRSAQQPAAAARELAPAAV